MTVQPLHSVGGIPFGADRSALSGLGSPLRRGVSRLGEDEVVFAEAIYRFSAGKLVEVSFRVPPVLTIDGQLVEAASLAEFLKKHDAGFREVCGFAIAPSLGLALDVDHENKWATAFVSGRWDHIK